MIYLKNRVTNKTIQVFENVICWGIDFVEYINGKFRSKIYCNEDEYFSDKEIDDVRE